MESFESNSGPRPHHLSNRVGATKQKIGETGSRNKKSRLPPRAEEEGEGAGEKAGRGPLARGETEGRREKVEKGVESLTDGRAVEGGEGSAPKGTTNATPVNWEQEHISYTNNSQTMKQYL